MKSESPKMETETDSESEYIPTSEVSSEEEFEDFSNILIKRKCQFNNNKRPKKLVKRVCPDLPQFGANKYKIKNINNLVKITEDYLDFKATNRIDNIIMEHLHDPKVIKYCDIHFPYERLIMILPELYEFEKLVGLNDLKVNIVDQILFFIQNLQSGELMHTVLYGEQGCGKTTICRIIARMYSNLGILSKGTFKIARRDDFVAGYLGQTAIKTKKLLESCKGGVLFIDEAYSLGPSKGDTDSFSKEAIDTLNQFLSENYEDFICIIAGYESNLKENFFDNNPGLDRRFPWKFYVSKYSSEELFKIFEYNFDNEWVLNITNRNSIIHRFDPSKFSNNGGDCKIIFDRCKIFHGRRLFNNPKSIRFEINDSDINNSLDEFYKNKKTNDNTVVMGLYL